MDKFAYDEFAQATGTESLLPITRRIAHVMNGNVLHNIPPFGVKEDLGEFNWAKNNIHVNGDLNATIRSCVDRVRVEADKLDRSKMRAISTEQFAALTSWAANWYRNRSGSGDTLISQSYGNSMPKAANLVQAYTIAARSLVAYINGDHDVDKFVSEAQDGDEVAYLDLDDEEESDKENDDEEHEDVGNRIFIIPFQDFVKFLDRDATTFDVMSRLIDEIPSLAITIDANKVRDEDGDEIDFSPLDINKLMRMSSDGFAALANPEPSYFPLAIENRDLRMREWYKITEQKRVELIMLDASGSMGRDNRAVRALGYMMNRLDKVIENKAIVAVCTFSESAYQLTLDDGTWVIDTPEKAERAKMAFYKRYISHPGGGTSIPSAVREGYKFATALTESVDMAIADSLAHMTIVTDDDSSSAWVPKTQKFIVNCLAVADNEGMRILCNETGGRYMPLSAIRVPVIK